MSYPDHIDFRFEHLKNEQVDLHHKTATMVLLISSYLLATKLKVVACECALRST